MAWDDGMIVMTCGGGGSLYASSINVGNFQNKNDTDVV